MFFFSAHLGDECSCLLSTQMSIDEEVVPAQEEANDPGDLEEENEDEREAHERGERVW